MAGLTRRGWEAHRIELVSKGLVDRKRRFRDATAIVGLGNSDYGALYRDRATKNSAYDLGVDALNRALSDAGMAMSDLDGLIVGGTLFSPYRFAEQIGLGDLSCFDAHYEGAFSTGANFQLACSAVHSGFAETVAYVYSTDARSTGAVFEPLRWAYTDYDYLHGVRGTTTYFAMWWNRYLYEHGGESEELATIAMQTREHASLNPVAIMRSPLSLEQYLESRYIVEPLRLFDCCLINDGAVAFIITSAERARDLRQPPVYVSAVEMMIRESPSFMRDDLRYSDMALLGRQTYGAAGIDREDVDCFQIYDHYTPGVVFTLEGFGFTPPGTGLEYARDGRTSIKGELPVNTSGGHLSESYMQGWGHIAEAVRQVRGDCGDRQVSNCQVAQYAIGGPELTASLILRA